MITEKTIKIGNGQSLKPVVTNDGYVRAYLIEDGGSLRLMEMTVGDDGVVLDYDLQPVVLDGPIHELMGWPDNYAVQVSSQLMIALK